MFRTPMLIAGTSIALVAVMMTGAIAGDRNEVLVWQESPNGTVHGNMLSIDQSAASDSLVTGINANSVGLLPSLALQASGVNPLLATQRGEGNAATLKLTGTGGEIQLLQASNPLMPWVVGGAGGNNTASVTAETNDLAAVIQVGSQNSAEMTLLGNSSGLISQLGNNLSAGLNVGAGGTGRIIQIGNNSSTGLVDVVAGANVTVTQIGNNISPVSPTAVQVVSTSNPGAISITQTAW